MQTRELCSGSVLQERAAGASSLVCTDLKSASELRILFQKALAFNIRKFLFIILIVKVIFKENAKYHCLARFKSFNVDVKLSRFIRCDDHTTEREKQSLLPKNKFDLGHVLNLAFLFNK